MQHKRELSPEACSGVRPVGGREFVLVATIRRQTASISSARCAMSQRRYAGTCEFAVTVADDWQRVGLAATLMRSLIRRAARDGYRSIEGLVQRRQPGDAQPARVAGFTVKFEPGDGSLRRVVRKLARPAPRCAGPGRRSCIPRAVARALAVLRRRQRDLAPERRLKKPASS